MSNQPKYTEEDLSVEEVLKKIEKTIQEATGETIVIFTPEEAKALKRVAARERAWMGVGFLLEQYKRIMMYIGIVMGAYAAVKSGVTDGLVKFFKMVVG